LKRGNPRLKLAACLERILVGSAVRLSNTENSRNVTPIIDQYFAPSVKIVKHANV